MHSIVNKCNHRKRRNPITTQRNCVEKETRYLPTFNGQDRTLHGFVSAVDQIMEEYNDNDKVFTVQHNNSRSDLYYAQYHPTNKLEGVEESYEILHHYRPRTDQMGLTRRT